MGYEHEPNHPEARFDNQYEEASPTLDITEPPFFAGKNFMELNQQVQNVLKERVQGQEITIFMHSHYNYLQTQQEEGLDPELATLDRLHNIYVHNLHSQIKTLSLGNISTIAFIEWEKCIKLK